MIEHDWWYWLVWTCWIAFSAWLLLKRIKNGKHWIARKNRRNTRSFKIPEGGTVTYDPGKDALSITGGTLGSLTIQNITTTSDLTISSCYIGGGTLFAGNTTLGVGLTLTGNMTVGTGVTIAGNNMVSNTTGSLTTGITFAGSSFSKPDYKSLPREKAELPLVAWKSASIRYIKGLYLFQPINVSHPRYDVEDDALCGHKSFHTEKDEFFACTCGFYALAKKPESSEWTAESLLCTLTVELSGLVLVCEQGYRATHQKVLRAEFLNYCSALGCDIAPVGFGFGEDDCLRPYCDAHQKEQRNTLSVEDLEQILEIEVIFSNETV